MTAKPKDVGQAVYEVVTADIHRRLGNALMPSWALLPAEDRAPWESGARAERAAELAPRDIPAHPSVEEALSGAAAGVLDAAAWLERVDPGQHSEESKRVHEFLDMVADVLKQMPTVPAGQQPAAPVPAGPALED